MKTASPILDDGSTESTSPALAKAPIASTFKFPAAKPSWVNAEPEPPKSARVTPEEKSGRRVDLLNKLSAIVGRVDGAPVGMMGAAKKSISSIAEHTSGVKRPPDSSMQRRPRSILGSQAGHGGMLTGGGNELPQSKDSGEHMKALIEKVAAEMPKATQEEKLAAIQAIAANMGFEDVILKAAQKRGFGTEKTASEEAAPGRRVKFNKLTIDDLVHHLSDEFGRPEWHEKEAAHYPAISKLAKLLEVERARPS